MPLNKTEKKLFGDLVTAILSCKTGSNLSSGLVFAGYGDSEIFPSLKCIEIDGVLDKKFKYWEKEAFDVDRRDHRGRVFAFAQQDVVDSFLYGGDYRFEDAIVDYFQAIGNGIVDAIKSVTKVAEKHKKAILQAIESHLSSSAVDYWDNVSPDIRNGFYRDVEDMVKAMPKKELIEFSEALVSITKLKRRVSPEEEDVGGPIDVAIISKHEGFIWVKRKHYFNREMNPRYYWRQFAKSKKAEADHGEDIGSASVETESLTGPRPSPDRDAGAPPPSHSDGTRQGGDGATKG